MRRRAALRRGSHDYVLNSKLLFHVVTDELSSAVVDDGIVGGKIGGLLRLLVPVILVPLAFAAIALVMLKVIEYLAQFAEQMARARIEQADARGNEASRRSVTARKVRSSSGRITGRRGSIR